MSKFPENSQMRTSAKFTKRIKQLIFDNDCASNKEFADLVGVSFPVISKAVNFGIIPSMRILVKIADKLEMSVTYVVGMTDKNEFIPSNTPSTFYARLEELTKSNNLNYGKLTSHLSFPRTYIYEWMKKETLPSIEYLIEIANFFDVSPDYLLGRTDFRK